MIFLTEPFQRAEKGRIRASPKVRVFLRVIGVFVVLKMDPAEGSEGSKEH